MQAAVAASRFIGTAGQTRHYKRSDHGSESSASTATMSGARNKGIAFVRHSRSQEPSRLQIVSEGFIMYNSAYSFEIRFNTL